MSKDDRDTAFIIFSALFTSAVIGVMCYARGFCDSAEHWQQQIIDHGAAEWYADPKTGERELRWKCGEVK